MMWRLNFFVFVTRGEEERHAVLHLSHAHAVHAVCVLCVGDRMRKRGTEVDMDQDGGVRRCVGVFVEIPASFVESFALRLYSPRNPAHPEVKPLHEWQFRSGLDRYVWIYGMLCAYASHVRRGDEMDRRAPDARAMYQTGIVTFAVGTLYWWWITFMTMDKHKYNMYPYTIPLTFFLLRNATKTPAPTT